MTGGGPRLAVPSHRRKAGYCSSIFTFLVLLIGWAALPGIAHADPWISPGNVQLRQDVELLADSGVIQIPITTWPIPWGSLAAELQSVDASRLSPVQQLAYERLLSGIRSVQAGGDHLGYKAQAAPGRPALNWFGDATRGKEEAGASWSGYDGNLAFRFNATAVYGSRDHQRVRFDGSYVGLVLGNWMLTAGQIDQYWGPAWSGSMILGTNSRPVPGVMLTRNVAKAFQTPVLHWLGPWTFSVFADRLGNDRYIHHPFLLGARVTFVPLNGVEFGLSRLALFGGKTRPEGFSCLYKTIVGHTNVQAGTTVDCAAQMVAISNRFHIPATQFTFYSQFTASDSSHSSVSKWADLLGLSRWGTIGVNGATYRAFLEYANTTINSWKQPLPNVQYENYLYQSGFRYRGYDVGYPTGNDSELWTAGVTLQGSDDGQLTFLLRHGTLNVDNTNAREPWGGNKLAPRRTAFDELDAYFRPSFWGGHLNFALGVTRWGPAGLPSETGLHAQVGWQMGFSE